MTHPDFAAIDAVPGNTMLIFDDVNFANAYVHHQAEIGVRGGIICRVEDTRTGSGLLVQWRDPIPMAELTRRQSEARWLLEEVLAGRVPRPERGKVIDITDETRAAIRRTKEQS